MIKPTVGRVVWYYPEISRVLDHIDQPCSAHIAYVHTDRLVNLMVIGHDGVPRGETCVKLVHDDDAVQDGTAYCTWMPYQKGQAAKTEAAEAALKTGSTGL